MSRLSPEAKLAKKGMMLSEVGRELLERAWEEGFEAGINRPRTATEAFHAPPVPLNPYRRKKRGRKKTSSA